MTPSRVASNSLLIVGAQVVDRLMRFVLVVFAARLLGDADYGKISFALAFGALFIILADFGLHQLLIREIAKRPDEAERLMGNGLFLKLLLAGFTALCIYAATQFTHKSAEVMMTVYVIGAAQITGSLAEYFSVVFQGFQQLKYDAVAAVILSVSNAVIGILVLLGGGTFLDLAWVYLIARMLKLVYCFAVARLKFTRIKFLFETALIKFFLFEAAAFGITRFFSVMYTNVDTTMLSLMVGDKEVGWYNVAYRLIFAMMVIPMGVMRAVYPALSAHFKSSPEAFSNLFDKTTKLMFLAGTTIASILFLLADQIIVLMFGEQFVNAAGALKILVWSTAIYFVGTVMTHTTRSAGKQGFTAKVVAASAVLNVVLNFVLIPRYSYIGAAFATLLSELFTFVFHFVYVRERLVKPKLVRLAPKIVVINLVTMGVICFFRSYPLALLLGMAAILNVTMVFVTGYFSREEVSRTLLILRGAK